MRVNLLILVTGSIIPSIITIFSNGISLRWIVRVRNSIKQRSNRHKDETRHVIIIIRVECLMAIINSWLVDVILSITHCGRSLAIADDCPDFFRRSQVILAISDLLNSMSNILLYCYASRLFRRQLKREIQNWFHVLKIFLNCSCFSQRVEWVRPRDSTSRQDCQQMDTSLKNRRSIALKKTSQTQNQELRLFHQSRRRFISM